MSRQSAVVQAKKLVSILVTAFLGGALVACGGGGGGGNGTTDTQVETPQPVDTRIGQQAISSPALLETFRQVDVRLTLTEQELSRERVYLKIETLAGEALFLGQADQPVSGDVVSVSVHVPVTISELRYQVFGDDGLLETRSGSIVL